MEANIIHRSVFIFTFLLIPVCYAKIYEKCDLAFELKNKFGFNEDEVKNFACIAQYESAFNTEAINNYNWDGSSDFGIFQLNNRYWCGSEYGSNVCNMDCNDLLDDDLTDDINCVRKIVNETKRWMKAGNGLEAWTAYVKTCQSENLNEYIAECADILAVRADDTTLETPTTTSEDIQDSAIPDQLGEAPKEGESPVISQVPGEGELALDSSVRPQTPNEAQRFPESVAPIRASGLGIPEEQDKQEIPQIIDSPRESTVGAETQSEFRPPVRASGLGADLAEPQVGISDQSSPVSYEEPVRVSESIAPVRASGLGIHEEQDKQEIPQSIELPRESTVGAETQSEFRPPVRASGLGADLAESQVGISDQSSQVSYEEPVRVSGMIEIPILPFPQSPELEIIEDVSLVLPEELIKISIPQENSDSDALTIELQDPILVDQVSIPENADPAKPFKLPDVEEIEGNQAASAVKSPSPPEQIDEIPPENESAMMPNLGNVQENQVASAVKSPAAEEQVDQAPPEKDIPKVKVPNNPYFPSIIPSPLISLFSPFLQMPFQQSPFSPRPFGLFDMLLRGTRRIPTIIFIAPLSNSGNLNTNSQLNTFSQSSRPRPNIFKAFNSQFNPMHYSFSGRPPSEEVPVEGSDFRKIPITELQGEPLDFELRKFFPEYENKPVEIPTLGFRPVEIPLKPLVVPFPEFGSKPLQVPKLGLANFDIPFPKLEFEKKPITLPTLSLQPLVLPHKKPIDFDFTKIIKPISLPTIEKKPFILPKIPTKQINIELKPIDIPKVNFKPFFSKPSLNIFKKG